MYFETCNAIYLQIYIAGEYHDCSSYGIDVIDAQQNEPRDEIVSDPSNNNESLSNNTPQNVPHEVRKKDVSNYTNLANRIVKEMYTANIIKPENSTGNLTQQDVMHINCSTHRVNCSMVNCDLNALKTQQDIGKLAVKMILNVTKLRGIQPQAQR